jgi:excisionase family DNA binding protein
MPDVTPELLTETEAAELLRQRVKTLQARRVTGGGVPFVKIGRTVRYRRADVLAYIAANVRTSTTEQPSPK